jgi:hypothetical protein
MMGNDCDDTSAPVPASLEGGPLFRAAIEQERNARQIGPVHEVRPLRVYVSGPMTGLPLLNVPAFMAAGLQLACEGLMPINPAALDHSHHDGSWAAHMRVDITHLMTCDAVAMLLGWQDSKGARVERDLALTLGMDVRELADWLPPVAGTHRPAAACPPECGGVGALAHCVCQRTQGAAA